MALTNYLPCRFLLKYVGRDRVDVLGKGSRGVAEAKAKVEGYTEKSPLYGLAQYRRRKIILKYVPEGTSRLLQGTPALGPECDQGHCSPPFTARLTVQFQTIVEKFSPHETIFSFTAPAELTEAALSTACMLHASASSLTSSSSSLRRQRLGEISEDVEESGSGRATSAALPFAKDSTSPSRQGRHDLTQQALRNALAESQYPGNPGHSPPPPSKEVQTPLSPLTPFSAPSISGPTAAIPSLGKSLPATPATPTALLRQPVAKKSPVSTGQEVHDPPERALERRRLSLERRYSSQSSRPSARDPDPAGSYSYISYQKKQKLGPRPSVNSQGRSKTTGSQGEQRPVANLPTSVRVSLRPPFTTVSRPGSQQSSRSVPAGFVPQRYEPMPPIPTTAALHISALYKPPQGEPQLPKPFLTTSRTPAITPEKQRLMKALQMRKRQMALSRRTSAPLSLDPQVNSFERLEMNTGKEVHEDLPSFQPNEPHNSPPDIMHVNLTEERKREAVEGMVSPLSFPEASDGPSTQGSSFTEENDNTNRDSIDEEQNPTSSPFEEGSMSTVTDPRSLKAEAMIEQLGPSPVTSTSTPAHLSTTLPQTNHAFAPLREDVPGPNTEAPNGDKVVRVCSNSESRTTGNSPTEDSQSAQVRSSGPEIELKTPATEMEPRVGSPRRSLLPQNVVEESSPDRHALHRITDIKMYDHTLGLPAADAKHRRRAFIDRINTFSSPEVSDVSDDDSFIEELRKAKVQEAKPISVARSPITPIFTRGSSDHLPEIARSRTALAPSQKQLNSTLSTPEKTRVAVEHSASSSVSQWQPIPAVPQAPLTKKGNLSSGISRRIKALELFTRDTNPSPPHSAHSTPPSPPAANKRSPTAQLGTPPNVSYATPSPRQLPTPTSSPSSNSYSNMVQQQTLAHLNKATTHLNSSHRKGNSISVTARIVRDDEDPNTNMHLDLLEPTRMSLHRSPLIVEREVADPASLNASRPGTSIDIQAKPVDPPPEVYIRPLSPSSRTSSYNKLQASDSMISRLSLLSKLSKNDSGNLPRSPSDNASLGEEKGKESRASRLIRRMSGLTTGSRRSLISALSPSVKEEGTPAPIAEHEAEASPAESEPGDSLLHVVDIGDVNVQFPDTLLWKRRFMRIDDKGYLILTPSAVEKNTRNVSRRFHLSDIRKPTLPDMDREEMKWSILLDFIDGSCLQCACESRYAQGQVLGSRLTCRTPHDCLADMSSSAHRCAQRVPFPLCQVSF